MCVGKGRLGREKCVCMCVCALVWLINKWIDLFRSLLMKGIWMLAEMFYCKIDHVDYSAVLSQRCQRCKKILRGTWTWKVKEWWRQREQRHRSISSFSTAFILRWLALREKSIQKLFFFFWKVCCNITSKSIQPPAGLEVLVRWTGKTSWYRPLST